MKSKEQDLLANSAEMQEYLALQKRLAEPRALAAQLEQLIAAKRDDIARAKACPTELPGLVSKREDLLADRALGHGVDAELAALGAEIDRREREATEVDSFIASEEQAIAGLERRLAAANQEIAALTCGQQEGVLIGAVLQVHAVELADEYMRAARSMKSIYQRIAAVDALSRQHKPGQRGVGVLGSFPFDVSEFEIHPCLMDESHCSVPQLQRFGRVVPLPLFKASDWPRGEVQSALQAERAALREAGLDRV